MQTDLAVDPKYADSGPVAFMPRSGGEGHLPHGESGYLSPDLVDEDRQVVPLPNRGDLLLWHPYTIHGSKPNTSKQARRILINGYAYPGATRRTYAGSEKGAGERYGHSADESRSTSLCRRRALFGNLKVGSRIEDPR